MTPLLYRLMAIAALAASSAASAAERPFAAPEMAGQAPASSAGSLTQATLSLLLVLAAVFAAAWVVRRLRGVGKFGANAIEIIADAPLGAKERAVLIQVGKQQLLLGVAPGRVTMLHVLQEPLVTNSADSGSGTDQPLPGGPRPPVSLGNFKAILKRSVGS